MRIVVHGQQAFGKAVLEALMKRGENIVAVYVAPDISVSVGDKQTNLARRRHLPNGRDCFLIERRTVD